MVRWKALASCTCHRMKFILVSSFKVTLVDTVLESGWMGTSTKAASKMDINKVMAPSCVRREGGHLVVTGSKAKWMAKALVSGKIAPSIKVSGVIASRRVLANWVTLMAPSIKVTSVTITPTDKERRLLLMARFTSVISWMDSSMVKGNTSSQPISRNMRANGSKMKLKVWAPRKLIMARSRLAVCLMRAMFKVKDLKSGQINKESSFIEVISKIHRSAGTGFSSGPMVDIISEIS